MKGRINATSTDIFSGISRPQVMYMWLVYISWITGLGRPKGRVRGKKEKICFPLHTRI